VVSSTAVMDPAHTNQDRRRMLQEPSTTTTSQPTNSQEFPQQQTCCGRHRSKRARRQRRSRFVDDEKDSKAAVQVEDFAVLNSPHPYGVLPGGNRFLLLSTTPGDNVGAASDKSSTSTTAMSDDECWYHILEFCDGIDLSRMLCTCKYFYAAGSEPELWRDLVLRDRHHETVAGGSVKIKTIDSAGPTWKDAYVKMKLQERCRGGSEVVDEKSHTSNRSVSDYRPHRPMTVNGVYSDFYYRLHSCRSFAIPDAWTDTRSDTVARVPCEEMTSDKFMKNFEERNRPVVIEGACRNWKAFERWKEPKYLLERASGRTFRATSGAAPLPGLFTLDAYYDYCCRSTHLEEAPLYLFDRTALAPGSELWIDYMDDLKATCPYFDPDRDDLRHDLFKILGEGRRPDHTWLIMGPRRSGSLFHVDPNATHAFNAAIAGRKFWIFYPPGVTPPGVLPSEDGDQVGAFLTF